MLKAIVKTFGSGGKQVKVTSKNVVFISGCDSGLGFSLATYCHSLDMTVISACHNIHSEGARMLQNINDPKRLMTIELDLLQQETIKNAQRFVSDLMQMNSEYHFTALVNNAGVMCFGEFEWQTREQIEMQINVNLLGTMHLTKEMLPLVRQHRGRIINVTSHCGLQALPTLGPYGASKAALKFWNDALRIEMNPYGVEVINFIPGSFVTLSNISARQQEHAKEMLKAFTHEQQHFYGPYFKKFNDYLSILSGVKPPNKMKDNGLLLKFKDALTSSLPKATYIHEPLRNSVFPERLFKMYQSNTINDLNEFNAEELVENLVVIGDFNICQKMDRNNFLKNWFIQNGLTSRLENSISITKGGTHIDWVFSNLAEENMNASTYETAYSYHDGIVINI